MKTTPYDRLNSVRRRVENLSSSKSGKQILQKSRQELLPSSGASSFAGIALPSPLLPTSVSSSVDNEQQPGLGSVLKAAAYDNQTADADSAEASSSRLLGFTHADKAARQMNQYFDYSNYSQQAPDDPARAKVKLTKKQIQSLKKKKVEKKIQKRLEWLYNDWKKYIKITIPQ